MNAIRVLTMLPLMLVGYAVGFLYAACAVGFHAGRTIVESTAAKCYQDLEAKKAARNVKAQTRAEDGR